MSICMNVRKTSKYQTVHKLRYGLGHMESLLMKLSLIDLIPQILSPGLNILGRTKICRGGTRCNNYPRISAVTYIFFPIKCYLKHGNVLSDTIKNRKAEINVRLQ